MPSTTTCSARASYKKLPGLLELTGTHLQWTQDNKKIPSVKVPYSEPNSLFCSKEGAPQVRLKVGLINDDAGHNFTFTSPQAVAVSEREKFKAELTNIIARNRSATATPAPSSKPPGTPALPSTGNSNVSSPRPPLPASRPSISRATSVASDSRATPSLETANDFRMRKKVLLSNPELAALHRELVMGGQISESEFWEGREHMLLAQQAAESQRKGKSGQIVDPRPQTVEGEVKIVVTPQLVRDIFEEYPVVAKAYSDNVPGTLNEAEFWKRYFQSKLFNAHRASIRSSATQHVVKDDPIFDKYLEKDDDELEPRSIRNDGVDIFIDLGATREDHGETGNEKDVTMQAGKQRAVLPLIRKFNEHSGRLLNSALGEPSAKRRKLDNDSHYSQIDLEDLYDAQSTDGIILDMQDRQRYFEGWSTDAAPVTERPNVRAAVQEVKHNMQGWSVRLNQFKLDKKAGEAALLSMTHNVAARLDTKSRKNDIPENILRQMSTCQVAANEFLRQFWLAIYPPATDLSTAAPTTPAQKAAKAAKMIGYLEKTGEKVSALVKSAQAGGVDPGKVQIAMKPVLDATEKALSFWRMRNSKAPGQR